MAPKMLLKVIILGPWSRPLHLSWHKRCSGSKRAAQGSPKGVKVPPKIIENLIKPAKNTHWNPHLKQSSNKWLPGTSKTWKYRFSRESEWHPAKPHKPLKSHKKSPKRHQNGTSFCSNIEKNAPEHHPDVSMIFTSTFGPAACKPG